MTHRTQRSVVIIIIITVYYKGYKWRARWRGIQGKVQKDPKHRSLCLYGVGMYHLSRTGMCSLTQKLLNSIVRGIFIEVLLCWHGWLNHCPLMTELNFHHLGSIPVLHQPWIFLLVYKRYSYHSENSKDFKSSMPGTESNNQCIFFIRLQKHC